MEATRTTHIQPFRPPTTARVVGCLYLSDHLHMLLDADVAPTPAPSHPTYPSIFQFFPRFIIQSSGGYAPQRLRRRRSNADMELHWALFLSSHGILMCER